MKNTPLESKRNLTAWGRHPRLETLASSFEKASQLRVLLEKPGECIAHGMGRSYGDSALNKRVILTGRFNKILDFDHASGVVTCESGVSLSEIVQTFLPRGWFPEVTPGTKFISIGGAIASDVHGKNHHKAGCFSESVISFDLMLPDGRIATCGRDKNSELFHATCGGMGLTGIILKTSFRLQRIKSGYIRETVVKCADLREIFERFEEYGETSYSVAWIDCLAKGKNVGRSVLMAGEHAESGRLNVPPPRRLGVPFPTPGACLNKWSVQMFNHLYYKSNPSFVDGRLTPLDEFFYPLDKIGSWNRIYGNRGFTQYQLVLPKESSLAGLTLILEKIEASGMGSFLAVLKLFGRENGNFLSFPMEGYTLALDFKIEKSLFPLLDELDNIVMDHGGRLYLAKDVRMSKNVFMKGYPKWERFERLRKELGLKGKFGSLQSARIGA